MTAAAAIGLALGIAAFTGGALLLYAAKGFLTSAGLLLAAVLAGLAAGIWVGAPGSADAPPRLGGRWMLAIAALALASFAATAWLRLPGLQTGPFAAPLGMVLFLAEPAYALGLLLAGLQAGASRAGRAWIPVLALLGAAAGVVLAGAWLIPSLPPGPVLFGTVLLLTGAGTAEMALRRGDTEGAMAGAVVLVTGAGKRGQVGFAVARAFADRGARVVLCSRSEGAAELAAELGPDALGVSGDLETEAGAAAVVRAAEERWGRLDVVVNAAGGLRVTGRLAETTPEQWSSEIDRNARTAFLVSRAALPLLRASRGSIVNFASPAAERPVAGLGAYGAGKAGVVSLTRVLALEEKASGVRVNAVAPGLLDTEANRASAEPGSAFVSLGALTDAVLFLAGARGVTGEVLKVTMADAEAG